MAVSKSAAATGARAKANQAKLDQARLDRELVFDMYRECMTAERHFNDLQSVYRKILSVWLIAALTAVGYVSSNDVIWPLERPLLIASIFLIAGLGVALLWCIDLLVYQRLLDAYFFEAIQMEKDYDWLPRIHLRMRTIRPAKHVTSWWRKFFPFVMPERNLARAALFYSMPTTVFIVSAIFCFGVWLGRIFRLRIDVVKGAWGWFDIVVPLNGPVLFGLFSVVVTVPVWRLLKRGMENTPINSRSSQDLPTKSESW